jgi:hypothetical protein
MSRMVRDFSQRDKIDNFGAIGFDNYTLPRINLTWDYNEQ